ncbi:TonB-dependent receptor plug domain-containing protein, partial [Sphingobacterium sp.]|uniref:TonB-dependent receptor plug domain-containing protein n=1 Tax=Sphingobacterium sp. TaxID=341027 RepID=UPI0028A03CE5
MFSLSAQTPRKDSGANGLLTVSGRVVSATDGKPIAGVSVALADEKGRASTKSDGSFTINVIAEKGKIVFSHLGYNAQSLSYTVGVSMDLRLIPIDNRLDETVVIGYGTTTRRFSTGSVTKVTSKDIQNQPISNPMLALQGLVPGLEVTPSSGISGSGVDLKVRGISSLTQGSEPLVLLNGNPIASNGQNIAELSNATKSGLSLFNAINPADIESIEVLKDADATAIYGSRGANGVILITTKKAFAEKGQLNFSSNIGVSRAGNVMPLLDTQGYLAMRREAFANSGLALTEANAPDLLLADTTRYTDFSKYLVGSNNLTQDYNLGYVTGGEHTSFRLNGNLRREAFQFDRSKSSDRYNIGFNVNHRSADRRFTLDMAGNFSQNSSDLTVYDPAAYLYLMPHLQLRNDDGSLNWKIGPYSFSSLGFTNPLAQLENSFSGKFKNLFANMGLQYQVYPDLNLRITGGYSFGNNNEKARYPSTGIDPSTSNLPYANFSNGSRYSWIVEPQLTYNKQIGLHNLNFLLGSSIQQDGSENTLLAGTNYSDDNLLGTIS